MTALNEIRHRGVPWKELPHHAIHHRGRFALMCRMAGGTPPGIYGANREEMLAIPARSATTAWFSTPPNMRLKLTGAPK